MTQEAFNKTLKQINSMTDEEYNKILEQSRQGDKELFYILEKMNNVTNEEKI